MVDNRTSLVTQTERYLSIHHPLILKNESDSYNLLVRKPL